MDQTSFDRIARLLGGAATRRQGLAAALGGALGLAAAAAPAPALRDAAAAPASRGRNRRPGLEGPCGDKSRKDNICEQDSDCCTGICGTKPSKKNKDRRGRCRCMQRGKGCSEDRNCCNTLTCIDKVCSHPAPTPPTCTVNDSGDADANGAALVAAIAAAADGATIDIEPGVYTADYTILKNITLVRCGDSGEVIMMNYSEYSDDNTAAEQGRVIVVGVAPAFKASPRGAGITVILDTISVVGNPSFAEGGGIYVSGGATLKLIGATAVRSAVQMASGAGILVEGGTLHAGCDRVADPTCTDSVMIGDADSNKGNSNIGPNDGGGISGIAAATVVLRGNATVQGNMADDGGGVYIDDDSTLLVTDDAKIVFNLALESGGGIRVKNSCLATLSGNALIADNGSKQGGGVWISSGKGLEITSTAVRITRNYAAEHAGGIYQSTSLDPAVGADATTVTGNTVTQTCANYWLDDGSVSPTCLLN